ncbi:N-acetylmuramoyl-L-alanine amidase [Hathewaya proteolytica DSM 3090]|uniref:N-acetylmuramoyl-L-alanine amidase n=1 Tax=Hathewaya proteolytica DSM 3090 TaxID=1121331 RepID=A0A1M6RYP0_9CLOT|nr:N-acetylmuramoyl-L-alanine amidase [Hathewaya proteolytica]SHK37614.1 N-acetylmuramoyl-L-alanine amidase [Hathewaya proteolytica DSM 3090]
MIPIKKQLIKYNFSKRNNSIKYIVIHDVGAISSAQNNRDYFAGGNRNSSADFFVDSNNVIQIIDYNNNYSWAVGDGRGRNGITNSNSISIEMCLESNMQPSEKTIQNTLDLTKQLMNELDIPIERVVRHYDASFKLCPKSFSASNWAKWNEFKTRLKGGENKMDKELLNKQLYAVECSINSVMANLYKEIDKLQVDLKAVQDLKTYVNKNVK